MSNVCSSAPMRSSIKPYIDSDEDVAPDHVQLFVSNDNSVYRTLEVDEKETLFEHISEPLNMSEIRNRFPSIGKRSIDDNNDDNDEDEDDDDDDEAEEVEDEKLWDANHIDQKATESLEEHDIENGEYIDDDDYPQIHYDEVGSAEKAVTQASKGPAEESDILDTDKAHYLTRREASRDWSSDPIDPDKYPDVEDPEDVDGLEPIDPSRIAALEGAKSVGKPFMRRDIAIERLEQVFKGGPEQAFGEIREFSLGQLQDVFDAVGDESFFLTGLKMYLDPESYRVLYAAYEHSYDQTQISRDEWELPLEETRLECQDEYGSVLYNSVFSSATNTPDPSAMGMLGCALGYYAKLAKVIGGLLIKGRSSCKSRCNFGTHLMKCFETYKGARNFLDGLADWESVRNMVGVVCATPNGTLDTVPSPQAILGYEETISNEISYYRHLEPVAASMDFEEELAELEAEYLWKTTSSENADPLAVSAAIVLDKCEMEQKDLSDYLQFSLDSCDIRDLYYCKNHYKHTKCLPDLTNTTNPCNNACCLEIKMANCAKTHCASKKAVNEFRVIANVVCSKYADTAYMNGELPFPDAGTTISTSTFAAVSTTDCDEEPTSTPTQSKPSPTPSDVSYEDPDEEGADQSLDKRQLEGPAGVSIGTQFGGDNSDDVKARVGESVCKLDEFSPGYDTSTCDKREVKDCIKEGIQYIKDDPEHFCPYCVNNNAYDECRCACCFGKYFSKVCYDPNCKDLSEKLRYKRYVKDVCKTKPITKFLFARDTADSELGFVEDKPRFKAHRTVRKSPHMTPDKDIDIFAGFDDIQPDVDSRDLDIPTNPNADMLDTMRKSSLRRPTKAARIQKRHPTDPSVRASKGPPVGDEVNSIANFAEKAHQKLGTSPAKFAKGALFRGSKSKKGRFSIEDRKKRPTGARESTENSQEYNRVTKRKKHRRVVGKTGKLKKAGRRSSLSGEKFGKGPKKQQKIRVLNSNTEHRAPGSRHRTPIAKREYHPTQYLAETELEYRKSIIPSGQKNSLRRKREDQSAYVKGPEIQENPLILMQALQAAAGQSPETSTVPSKVQPGQGMGVTAAKYMTLTKTITRTGTGDIPVTVTSKKTSTSTMTLPLITPIEFTPTPTDASTAPSNEQSPYARSTTTVHLTATVTSPLTITDTLTVVSTELGSATTICAPNISTVTSIQTRYRKSTAIETEYQSVSTVTTTEWDEIITETSYKKTVFRYKDTFYGTSTIPTTLVTTTTKEKIVPNITVTEFEESDHTVNITLTLLDTTTETNYETVYREVSVSTLTTYSSTLTTSVYKYTMTKFKKWGEITTTTTTTETDDVILTRWYPETTLTEYDETLTKPKYKWYPITYTDYETEWDTETTTDWETTTTTVFHQARPVPTVSLPNLASILTSLLGRRGYKEEVSQEAYKASKTRDQGDFNFDDNVEYVIIEEIVEVIYPGEDDLIMALSVPHTSDHNEANEFGTNYTTPNSSNSSTTKDLNDVKDLGKVKHSSNPNYRNRSHELSWPGQENEESGTNKIFLDSNLVYVSCLLLLLAGATFILVPDGADDEILAEGAQEHDISVDMDNDGDVEA